MGDIPKPVEIPVRSGCCCPCWYRLSIRKQVCIVCGVACVTGTALLPVLFILKAWGPGVAKCLMDIIKACGEHVFCRCCNCLPGSKNIMCGIENACAQCGSCTFACQTTSGGKCF